MIVFLPALHTDKSPALTCSYTSIQCTTPRSYPPETYAKSTDISRFLSISQVRGYLASVFLLIVEHIGLVNRELRNTLHESL
jgi:hypothetical protein